MGFNVERVRADFPAIAKSGYVYFDSACTTLKPRPVIDAVREYYEESGACPRSAHRLAREVGERFEESRRAVARFVGAKAEGTVWTRNTTEGINLVAKSLDFSKRNEVVLSNLEHHSALLPFQYLASRNVVKTRFVLADQQGEFDVNAWGAAISRKTRLVVVHHTTNTTGQRSPLRDIAKIAHDAGALVLVDGAQGVPHHALNFARLGVDFLAFSGHKMLGPTGIGCLVAKPEILEELPPFLLGGETILHATLEGMELDAAPHKFEAGIQHYDGVFGLRAAVAYLEKTGMPAIEAHEQKLAARLLDVLLAHGAKIYGSLNSRKRCALAAFQIGSLTPKQAASFFDSAARIAVRGGFFCAEPAMRHFGAPRGAVRASLYLYNTLAELDAFDGSVQ